MKHIICTSLVGNYRTALREPNRPGARRSRRFNVRTHDDAEKFSAADLRMVKRPEGRAPLRGGVAADFRIALACFIIALSFSTSAFAAAESDLLVSYDNTYASSVGGEDNAQVSAANAIAGCNAIYDRSGAGARIRIVGYHQAAQNLYQTTSKGGYVNWMNGYDAHMTDIVDAGNARGADLVTLICVSTADGALAVAQQPGRYSAFDPSGLWSTVVAHELGGHNFGCDHRDGHTNPKTVMLHNYCGGGAQGWFSNPNIWLNGARLLGGDSCLGVGPNGGDNSYLISANCQGRADAYTRIVTAPNLGNVVRRWSFNQTASDAPAGTTVTDSITGTELATVQGTGANFTGSGLKIPGGASGSGAAYLQLPGGVISSYANVTIEIWAKEISAQNWALVLDFNNGTANYLTLTASIGTDLNQQRFESVVGGATAASRPRRACCIITRSLTPAPAAAAGRGRGFATAIKLLISKSPTRSRRCRT